MHRAAFFLPDAGEQRLEQCGTGSRFGILFSVLPKEPEGRSQARLGGGEEARRVRAAFLERRLRGIEPGELNLV